MLLAGCLRLTTLGDLLGALHRGRVSGALELTEAASGRVHSVYLREGLVIGVRSALGPPILELLEEEGLPEDLLSQCRSAACKEEAQLDWLCDHVRANRQSLERALGAQALARLDRIEQLGDARVRFRAGSRSGRPVVNVELEASAFLAGRARRRDREGTKADSKTPGADAGEVAHPRLRALHTLGLDTGATLADVRRRFRGLAKAAHPDLRPGLPPADRVHLLRRFAELSAAYHALVP